MPRVNITLSIPDEHLPNYRELVKQLKQAGLQVDQEMEALGIVTGSVDAEKIDHLKRIKGIGNIEQSREYQLPPPDSDVQ